MATFDAVKLQSLLEIDRRGSISAAARALHLTASAVSQHISALERAAGTELLHRSSSGSRLTPTGRAIAGHAAAIERTLEALACELAGPDSQFDLGVGFVPSVAPVLASAIADHARTWPGCTLRAVEIAPEDARRAVLNGDLDAAVTIDWPDQPQARLDEVDELVLLVEPLLVAHPRTARPDEPRLARFAHRPWVAASADTGCGAAFRAACRRAGFEPEIRHQTNDFAAAVALAARADCVTIVPALFRPAVPRSLTTTQVADLERHVLLVNRHVLAPAIGTLTEHLQRHVDLLAQT